MRPIRALKPIKTSPLHSSIPIHKGKSSSTSLNKWFFFPDSLPNNRFTGFQTRDARSINRGAFVNGQNVKMSLGQTPTPRNGYEFVGVTSLGDSTPVNRAWVYETRDGVQIELKAFSTKIYAFVVGTSTDWATLLTGLTSGLEFGYANITQTGDIAGATMFCNGTDAWYKFTGAFAQYASSTTVGGDKQITIQGSTNLIARYFRPEGTIIINGTSITYTELNGLTFKGCSALPTATAGDMIFQQPTPIDGTYLYQVYNQIFATYTSDDGATVITVNSTTGFASPSGTLRFRGADITYTGVTATTFTGCNTVPSLASPAGVAGDVIAQKPGSQKSLSSFLSQVMMAHDDRVHARQDTKKSVWNYSVLGNQYDFATTGSSDTNAGAKDVEFGGPITAFGKLNQSAICLKKRTIKLLDFIQVGSRVDSPQYKTMVSVDDKGASLGAVGQKSTFSTPKGLVFITPDKRMVLLSSIAANGQPTYVFLSDPIQQIFQAGIHDSQSVGICKDNEIWYSFKSSISSTINDIEIHGNLMRSTVDNYGQVIPIQWDTPTIGKNVADYTVVYNSAKGINELHWHSALNSDSWRVIDDKVDNTAAFTSSIRTWAETFGAPTYQKRIDRCFIEILMNANTNILVTLLYDEDGFTSQAVYNLLGTATNYLFEQIPYNPFGSSPFGWQMIGSNPQESALNLYRFELEVDAKILFFNLSLQIDGQNQNDDYDLQRFGYRLTEVLAENDVRYRFGIT